MKTRIPVNIYLLKKLRSAKHALLSLPVLALPLLLWQTDAFAQVYFRFTTPLTPNTVVENTLNNRTFTFVSRNRPQTSVGTSNFYMTGAPTGLSITGYSVSGSFPTFTVSLTFGWTGDITSNTTVTVYARRLNFFLGVTPASDMNTGSFTITPAPAKELRVSTPTSNSQVTEGSTTTSTFTVSLGQAPSGNVSVAVSSSDTGEGTVMPSTLTFTTMNYSTAQTVTVTSAQDTVHDGTQSWNVVLNPSSSADSTYNGLSNVNVAMSTADDEPAPTATLQLSATSISEDGGTTDVTATLSGVSAAATTITVSASPGSGTDFNLSSNTMLTIAAGQTTSTGQVRITAIDNNVFAADKSVTVSGAVSNTVGGISDPSSLTLTIENDEAERVLSSDSSLSSLVLSAGELSPSFSSSTLSYTATVDRSIEQLTVTPTANTAVSGIRVNSRRVSSGSASRSIELSFGENPISVLVLAENLSYRVYQIVVTREMADRTPDEFSFATQSDAEPGSTVTSETITVAGLGEGESAEISVSGGTLIVDGREFSGTTVTNGQRVAVAVVASDESGGTMTAMVTIGDMRADFTVETRDALSANQTPEAFSFAAKDGVDPGSRVTSDAVTISGLGDGVAAAISVSGGTLSVDGREFSGATVTNGQQVAVSVVASREFGGITTATVTIGGVRGEFTATTRTASSNADLGSLSFSPTAQLIPSFATGTVSYTASVSGQLATLTILATPAHPGANVNISPSDSSASTTGHQMNLNTGSNTATIVVTAEDNRTRKTYTVAVTRSAMGIIEELDREIAAEVSREVVGSTLQAIAGRINSVVGNVPATVPTTGSAGGLVPILEIFNRHDHDSSSTRSNLHQSLDGANFVLSLTSGNAAGSMQVADEEDGMASGGVAIWGSADYRNISSGKNSAVNWDGELFSVHVGSDALLESGLLIGLSASVSRGNFDYSSGNRNTRGQLKTRMTSLHPYLGWMASDRLNLWGTAGYGQGRIEYNNGGFGQVASDAALTTVAFGSRYRLNTGEQRMPDESVMVALKTEAWGTRLSVEGNEMRPAKYSIRTHGIRLVIEGSQERKMETGGTLTPSGELGVRWDGGAGDTGIGVELGGDLKLLAPCLCQTVNASARYLATHESGRKDWGAGMSIRRDLNYDRTGMSYGASLSHGKTGNAVESLWESAAAVRADEDNRLATRAEAEVGYGSYGADGIYTPYAGLGLVDDGSRDYAVGIRYSGEAALSLGLELNRFEKTDKSPDHRIMLTGQVDW